MTQAWYQVEIITTPAVSGTWAASFDGGLSWVDGEHTTGALWRWLVAGPAFNPAAPGMPAPTPHQVVSSTTTPLGRIIEAPEVEVVLLPQISLI
ncbi:MAG: hypothetical protein KBF43_09100 [Dermatophilaceae bacterium]|nr:hypothetical protein [Dermatophilaceae bacterium]